MCPGAAPKRLPFRRNAAPCPPAPARRLQAGRASRPATRAHRAFSGRHARARLWSARSGRPCAHAVRPPRRPARARSPRRTRGRGARPASPQPVGRACARPADPDAAPAAPSARPTPRSRRGPPARPVRFAIQRAPHPHRSCGAGRPRRSSSRPGRPEPSRLPPLRRRTAQGDAAPPARLVAPGRPVPAPR
ncbi:hypothetical protein D3C86_1494680 [compost metagenome]